MAGAEPRFGDDAVSTGDPAVTALMRRRRTGAYLSIPAAVLAQYGPALMGVNGLPHLMSRTAAGVGRTDHIALTFDDGPDAAGTTAVLRTLAGYRVHATFFVVAEQVARNSGVLRRIIDGGHEVALHGPDHRPLPLRDPVRTMAGLRRARDLLEFFGCGPVRWYRPPYGAATGVALLAAKRLGLQAVWWTAWGRDWSAKATAESIARSVLRTLRPGGTVLLHDSDGYAAPGSWQRTVAALPGILDGCAARGCIPGPLREHW